MTTLLELNAQWLVSDRVEGCAEREKHRGQGLDLQGQDPTVQACDFLANTQTQAHSVDIAIAGGIAPVKPIKSALRKIIRDIKG